MADQPLGRILIVDDEEALMKALSNTLAENGYATTGVTCGASALAALAGNKFDLLLSDLNMPEMDGIAVLRQARATDPELIGIIMTGNGTISTAVEAMKSGAFDYITKPFRLAAILPVLARAMGVRRLSQEKAALECRVRERTEQLEAANRELESFSFSVSHDLRAPLRHISGYAGLLAQSDKTTFAPRDREYLDHIGEASRRMSRLIDDLLSFSRMGRSEMSRAAIDPAAVVEDTLRQIQPETQGRNIVWKRSPLPHVHADLALLRQVYSNLLLNAVKYTGPRDPAEIEIGAASDSDGHVVLFVRDNGVGFDMKYTDRLFGVFQRLHRQDEFEGTGLGLANVRRIISRHGGRTWAEGAVGRGATIYFTLPKPA